MKSLLGRRPSPALVISLIALFVSLSGVSYGVATGFIDSREIKNNEVRSLDIRNNQIRTRDLRNNEVRGIDIRNSTIQSRDIGLNQVTGLDVREDTLQKVPSALVADTATNAANATSAASARSLDTLKLIAPITIAEGAAPVALVTHGPLTVTAACVADMATGTRLSIRVQTTEAGSAAAGGTTPAPPAVLGPGDGAQEVSFVADARRRAAHIRARHLHRLRAQREGPDRRRGHGRGRVGRRLVHRARPDRPRRIGLPLAQLSCFDRTEDAAGHVRHREPVRDGDVPVRPVGAALAPSEKALPPG